MKIAILTSGILPVPAVRGGAVENLTDFYLEYNDQHRLHDITVYSVADVAVWQHPALQSAVNHYVYIKVDGFMAKLRKRLYHWLHRRDEYYHYTIEYFLHEAIRHIRRQHYDIIILENRPGYALKLLGETEARLVYHLHNDLLSNTTRQHQAVYDAAARIVVVSDYIRSRVASIQSDDRKAVCVHNGIDLHAFATTIQPTHHLHFTLIFSGRLIPEKGILPLIQAMQLLKEHTDIRLLILGSTSLGSNEKENDFKRQLHAAAEGLDSITFTGYVSYAKIGTYLQQSDVAVVPSLWAEPFGLTCAEALAAGLPLITTRQGGIPEVVTEECAMLLEADEHLPKHLAQAILDLYHHPERRQAMRQAAQQQAQRFSKQRYAEDFYHAIEGL